MEEKRFRIWCRSDRAQQLELGALGGPEGRVRESLILASFDRESSATVTAALNAWRFHSIQELSEIFENSKNCEDCIRIGRFGFEFQIASGKGSVVDLAAAEVRRRGLANPFLKKTH